MRQTLEPWWEEEDTQWRKCCPERQPKRRGGGGGWRAVNWVFQKLKTSMCRFKPSYVVVQWRLCAKLEYFVPESSHQSLGLTLEQFGHPNLFFFEICLAIKWIPLQRIRASQTFSTYISTNHWSHHILKCFIIHQNHSFGQLWMKLLKEENHHPRFYI